MAAQASLWRAIDWGRLGRRCLVAAPVVLAATAMYVAVRGGQYGSDFRGGAWKAAHDVLAGRSPYVHPDAATLLAHPHAFIPPPLLALVAVPLARLPFAPAVAIWTIVCAGAFGAALYVLGLRRPVLYVIALTSFPVVASLIWGHPDGLLALGAAFAWRYRDSRRGAVAVGVLVAAKLLAWPLILWLLVTRRFRNALIAIGSTVTVLALSWAPIGFTGVTTYPRLLAADAHAWQERSYSLVAAFMRLGAPDTIARGLAAATACMVAVEIVRTVGMSDQAWFVAALGFGLLVSPLLELSYLTVLFVALTILRPRLDRFWLLPAALWLAPPGLLPQMAQVAIVIAVLIVTLVRATGAERHPLRALLSSRLA